MNLYDPKYFSLTAKIVSEEIANYLAQVRQPPHRALEFQEPLEMLAKVSRLSVGHDSALEPRLREIIQNTLRYSMRLNSPNYMGHQVNPPVPIAGALTMLGGILNPGLGVYEMSQFASATERFMIKEFVSQLGWHREESDGIITSGGTLANTTALLAARGFHFKDSWQKGLGGLKPAILTSGESHYSIMRAAAILGLGADAVFKVPVDSYFRMRPDQLEVVRREAEAKGYQVFCVIGSACTTSVGAFDPLVPIADFCSRYGYWFHVDAAHGGGYLLSNQQRHLLAGIELADSVTWDAHKMMFVPSLCTFLLYRDRVKSYAPFHQDAPYLFDSESMRDFDGGLRTVECTKGQLVYPLWVLWSLFGPKMFADLVDQTSAVTQTFFRMVDDSVDFQAVHKPECNIFCFRYTPAECAHASADLLSSYQKRIREELVRDGRFFITGTSINGVYALRVTIINPSTSGEHLRALLERIREIGAAGFGS